MTGERASLINGVGMMRMIFSSLAAVGVAAFLTGCGGVAVIDGGDVEERQPEALWNYIDDTAGNDLMRSLAFDVDGNVLAIGAAAPTPNAAGTDALLVKLDRNGEVIFRNVINGNSSNEDYGFDVAALGSDTLALLRMDSITTLARYDVGGTEVWSQEWSGKESYLLAVTEDGRIVLSGSSSTGSMFTEPWMAVLNDAGDVLLDQKYAVSADALFSGPAVDGDGHVYVMYLEKDAEDSLELRRYGLDGQLQRNRASDCGGLVAADAGGRVATVMAGLSVGTGVRLCMHTSELDRLWEVEVTRAGSDYIGVQGLSFDGEGNVLISGFSLAEEDENVSEMFVRKYNGEGKLLWDDGYLGPDGVFAYGFGVAADGDHHTVTAALTTGPTLDGYAGLVRMIRD